MGWLLFAHLLADYPLQGDFLAQNKGKSVLLMASHCGIWTGCICLAMRAQGWPIAIRLAAGWLFAVHFLADEAKARNVGFYRHVGPLAGLLIDQAFHVMQIIGVVLWVAHKGA